MATSHSILFPRSLSAKEYESTPIDSMKSDLHRILAEIDSDSVLRIRFHDGAVVEGTITLNSGFTLRDRVTAEIRPLYLSDIVAIHEYGVSKWKGHLVGGVLGGIVGASILTAVGLHLKDLGCGFDTSRCNDGNDSGIVFVGVLAGGAVGAFIGAVIGHHASSGSPVWRERYPKDLRYR